MSTSSSTSAPKVEESKGFMTLPHSTTDTRGIATSIELTEFTGTAVPGIVVPLLQRKAGWHIAVLGASMGSGMLSLYL